MQPVPQVRQLAKVLETIGSGEQSVASESPRLSQLASTQFQVQLSLEVGVMLNWHRVALDWARTMAGPTASPSMNELASLARGHAPLLAQRLLFWSLCWCELPLRSMGFARHHSKP